MVEMIFHKLSWVSFKTILSKSQAVIHGILHVVFLVDLVVHLGLALRSLDGGAYLLAAAVFLHGRVQRLVRPSPDRAQVVNL